MCNEAPEQHHLPVVQRHYCVRESAVPLRMTLGGPRPPRAHPTAHTCGLKMPKVVKNCPRRSRPLVCQDCWRVATFGPRDVGVAVRCKDHAQPGDLQIRHRKCAHHGCGTNPSFGTPGTGRAGALWCRTHSSPSHVNLLGKRCAHAGCDKHASFGEAALGRSGAKWCVAHKAPGAVNVKDSKCLFPACTRPGHVGKQSQPQPQPQPRHCCGGGALSHAHRTEDLLWWRPGTVSVMALPHYCLFLGGGLYVPWMGPTAEEVEVAWALCGLQYSH